MECDIIDEYGETDDKYRIIFCNNAELVINKDMLDLCPKLSKLLKYKNQIELSNIELQSFLHIQTFLTNKDATKDTELKNMNHTVLIDTIYAADFLEIPELVTIMGDYFKSIVLGKSAQEARRILKIDDNFTSEDLEIINQNLNWK